MIEKIYNNINFNLKEKINLPVYYHDLNIDQKDFLMN